jgi:hypothetical protein
LHVSCAIVDRANPDTGYTGVTNDGHAKADFRRVVQGWPLSNFTDDGKQIIQCLEHVRSLGLF